MFQATARLVCCRKKRLVSDTQLTKQLTTTQTVSDSALCWHRLVWHILIRARRLKRFGDFSLAGEICKCYKARANIKKRLIVYKGKLLAALEETPEPVSDSEKKTYLDEASL